MTVPNDHLELTPSVQSTTVHRTEMLIGVLLRAGVLISAALVLLGGALFLMRNGGSTPTLDKFAGEPSSLRSAHGIAEWVLRGSGRGLIAFGLLTLVLTPVTRVGLTLLLFLRQRDWVFVLITGIVLVALLSTLAPLM